MTIFTNASYVRDAGCRFVKCDEVIGDKRGWRGEGGLGGGCQGCGGEGGSPLSHKYELKVKTEIRKMVF